MTRKLNTIVSKKVRLREQAANVVLGTILGLNTTSTATTKNDYQCDFFFSVESFWVTIL